MVALTLTVYVLVEWVFAPMRSPGSDHVHLFARGPFEIGPFEKNIPITNNTKHL